MKFGWSEILSPSGTWKVLFPSENVKTQTVYSTEFEKQLIKCIFYYWLFELS